MDRQKKATLRSPRGGDQWALECAGMDLHIEFHLTCLHANGIYPIITIKNYYISHVDNLFLNDVKHYI